MFNSLSSLLSLPNVFSCRENGIDKSLEDLLLFFRNNYFSSKGIIHQSWFNTKENVPDSWKESQYQWISLHPGWLYILWSKKMSRDFVQRFEPQFLDTYDGYKYEIQRIDSIRPIGLKWLSGVYSDLDIVPQENIEKYISKCQDIYLVRSANTASNYTNAFMVSNASALILGIDNKNTLWDTMISNMIKRRDKFYPGKFLLVMNLTGPILLTDSVLEYSKPIGQLPSTFNNDRIDGSIVTKDKSVLKNLNGSSWHALDSHIINFVFVNKWFLGMIGLLLIFIFVLLFFRIRKNLQTCKQSLNRCLSK